MTPQLITIVLTVLAAVVVVLTRVRLASKQGGAGRLSIPHTLLNTHTISGLLALAAWSYFLYAGNVFIGWIGLLLWWITVVAGLLILARWMPAKGRHSSAPVADTWGEGPGLSVLAHVGLLVGVLIFTVLLLMGELS
ncbi:MAG TPA: hypothetical protein VLA97_17835 [Nocardioidaceae bacterium]|nr:hypothetical protein [Nocardioidaceae bacterium]